MPHTGVGPLLLLQFNELLAVWVLCMLRMKSVVISVIALASLSATYCGKRAPGRQPQTLEKQPAPDPGEDPGNKAVFKYDMKEKKCLANGIEGYNYNVIGECAVIKNKDLDGQDLHGKSFKGAVITDTSFAHANLADSSFFGASIKDTDFTAAVLTNADVSWTYFGSATFDSAKLQGAAFMKMGSEGKLLTANLDYGNTFTKAEFDFRTTMNKTLDDAVYAGMVYQNAFSSSVIVAGDKITSVDGIPFNIELSTRGPAKLSAIVATRVQGDFGAISGIKIDPKNAYFLKIFGGTSSANILNYLSPRISYVNGVLGNAGFVTIEAEATNSSNSWVARLATEYSLGFTSTPKTVDINGRAVQIDSPRTGTIHLGGGFLNLKTSYLSRISTLVHEARHSDCAVNYTKEEAGWLFSTDKTVQEKAPKQCNHRHTICQSGPLAGEPACDGHAWGSYALEAIYFDALALDCPSCSEDDRQLALVESKDAMSRVTNWSDLIAGKLGDPVMTSIK